MVHLSVNDLNTKTATLLSSGGGNCTNGQSVVVVDRVGRPRCRYRVKPNLVCQPGKFVREFDRLGNPICAAFLE